MEIFRSENIVKKYANHLALDKVSISINEGSIFGLLGPNGAGKTTFIRIINQITAPDSGKLFLYNNKLKANDIYRIGYLPEERGLYKKMKVGEQTLYLAQLKGLSKKDALKKLKYWFEKFEIQAWWDKKVEELSKGMQQKIQFIVTILHEPKLLIFDEPFTGFDPINTNIIKNEILKLKENGATVIFSTHNMDSVEELCDHIALINNSKKILDGQIDDIRQHYKSNTYEISFTGNLENFKSNINNDFEIISSDKTKKNNSNDEYVVHVKLNNGSTPNDLLSMGLPSVQIKSFNELLPSMNDIFIKVVEEKKSAIEI